jgi:hypothetical protein
MYGTRNQCSRRVGYDSLLGSHISFMIGPFTINLFKQKRLVCVSDTQLSSRLSLVIEISVFRLGDAILLGREAVAL